MGAKVVIVVSALLVTLLGPRPAGAGVSSLVLDALPASRHPGDSFVLTGAGCPPTGDHPTNPPLYLLLTTPGHPTVIGALFVNGIATPIISSPGFPGEVQIDATPEADGTFAVTFTIPDDSPPGAGYTVQAVCLTLLEPSDDGITPTPESFAVANAEVGTLEVVAAPDDTTSTTAAVTTTTAAPVAGVRPVLTG